MSLHVWTRHLDSEEMLEFLTYIDTLQPPYQLVDGIREEKIREGGGLMFRPQPGHHREAVFIKTKWG